MIRAVELEEIAISRGARSLFGGFSLRLSAGEAVMLAGANGAGKTSLLRAVAGRLPFAAGLCCVDSEDLSADRAGRARRFGFSPPADTLPDALRARDVLALVGGDLDRVAASLGPVYDALGLAPLLDRWIGDCSAGMRQRIAIAAAFASGQRLVILDEPFNWLDPVAIYDLREALRNMVDNGLTLVTALHDLGTLATVCDGGVMLAEGRVAMALDAAMLRAAALDPRAFERRTIDLLRS